MTLTIESPYVAFGSCVVQVAPSGEVRITPVPMWPPTSCVPIEPTATNWLSPHATAESPPVVPDVRGVQVSASGDVKIAPDPVTTTNCPSPQAMPAG